MSTMTAEPRFAYGYDAVLDDGTRVESGLGNMKTLEELFQIYTVAKAHSEARRRHCGLWLFAYDNGIPAGPGTFWRSAAQQGSVVGGAPVGASWHQGKDGKNGVGALACDNVPTSFQHWCAANQALITQMFGLVIYRSSSDPQCWNEANGRSYSVSSKQEWWHSQPGRMARLITYGRGTFRGDPDLGYYPIEPKYDIDIVGLRFWEHELWGGTTPSEPPVVIPPENPPTVPSSPPVPDQPTGVYALNSYRRDVVQGSTGKAAKLCQQAINVLSGQGIAEDGQFGPQSVAALKNVQAVLQVPPDGQCGPRTWQAMEDGLRTQLERGE